MPASRRDREPLRTWPCRSRWHGPGHSRPATPRSVSEWRQSVSKPTRLDATVSARTARSEATAGRRRHHRPACSSFETGRARIGNPSSQRFRSSASASAEAYRRRGSFRRQVRAIVSRSRGRPGTSVLGGAGSRVRTRSSVSITDAAWNGGRPVKRLYRVAPRA